MKKEGGKGLGISSYGVSMTTLEEVFLHLGEEEEQEEEGEGEQETSCTRWFRSKSRKIGYSNENLSERLAKR
jgi:ATP-binding cassette subfamily A (ABC1) protein 5